MLTIEELKILLADFVIRVRTLELENEKLRAELEKERAD